VKKKRICVLGSNSGRNAGDAAILSSIIDNFSAIDGDLAFEVPTTHCGYVKKAFPGKDIRPVSIMPWTGSVRLLGLSTMASIFRSDVVLITDGIIFDVKLFNPLFNFLILLAFLVPFARLCGKKVVCFCVGVGPLDTAPGRRLARMVCNLSEAVMVREESSAALVREIGVREDLIKIYADAAFVNNPAPPGRGDEILRENGIASGEKVIGVNVNSYIDLWLRKSERLDRATFTAEFARALDLVIDRLGARVACVITQVMDRTIADEILAAMKHGERVPVISNETYDNREIMAVMGRLEIFVGMRLHSLILASAMSTPVLGLAYAPKVRHFMKMLGTEDRIFELDRTTGEALSEAIISSWEGREENLRKVRPVMDEVKKKARAAYRDAYERYLG